MRPDGEIAARSPGMRERRPFQIGISRGLLVGFGSLVFLAIVAVLGVGVWSARQNTYDLLHDKSESTVALLTARLEQYLGPVEDQLLHLGRQIEDGAIELGDEAKVISHLSGALAATPQVSSLILVRADARMVVVVRLPEGVTVRITDARTMSSAVLALEAAHQMSELFWGDVVYPVGVDASLLNAHYPLRRDGRFLGGLIATVEAGRLSSLLGRTAEALGGSVFVLYGQRGQVLAHPRLPGGNFKLHSGKPLPLISEIADPVLDAAGITAVGTAAPTAGDAAGARTEDVGRRVSNLEARTGIRIVDAGEGQFALLSKVLRKYGGVPWLLGVYFPAAALTDELARLRWAAIAGGLVLLLSLLAAWLLARTLSAPFSRLAVAAEHVRNLAFDRAQQLPTSLFDEVTRAYRAFDAMVVGLRWFETYVPRALVHRLMGQDGAAAASANRRTTVLFTDIVGFTRQSETMDAEETADFLNGHFAMLTDCVEAEDGTVDKFIGDGLMAFWGAPEEMADHAARACRAALAMRAAVAADNRRRRTEGLAPVRMRVGIHTGSVVVGNIGAPGRINYTIVGDTVNTASRVERLAKELAPEEPDVAIIASARTIDAAGDGIDAAPIGTRTIRGRKRRIGLHRL